ncbi:uncharacterized protein BO66DRAFT_37114 [Aspergillus aculeatinus CBS 121060]|uniref:Uncharacterized protein n=1 Tax=Aspergillus aculeatinus CBS 121060 TaxID=1448322 RepID=A0ACD1HF69_9EURO|nr:hypothetical protein BO66DRAFT_37114 [Aspergillus aculeatinus CBS 121060]RAH72070.1 hypothetical protein BO66DRAFT_37114 [Aspergillus aculeatinus CBS 121060]
MLCFFLSFSDRSTEYLSRPHVIFLPARPRTVDRRLAGYTVRNAHELIWQVHDYLCRQLGTQAIGTIGSSTLRLSGSMQLVRVAILFAGLRGNSTILYTGTEYMPAKCKITKQHISGLQLAHLFFIVFKAISD